MLLHMFVHTWLSMLFYEIVSKGKGYWDFRLTTMPMAAVKLPLPSFILHSIPP